MQGSYFGIDERIGFILCCRHYDAAKTSDKAAAESNIILHLNNFIVDYYEVFEETPIEKRLKVEGAKRSFEKFPRRRNCTASPLQQALFMLAQGLFEPSRVSTHCKIHFPRYQ